MAIACIALPALYFVFYISVGNPLGLVFVGAIAQALMLPFLCIAALYFLYTQTEDRLRPGKAWIFFLWISSGMMATVGIYQLVDKLKSM